MYRILIKIPVFDQFMELLSYILIYVFSHEVLDEFLTGGVLDL
jgi:hypothetical protein